MSIVNYATGTQSCTVTTEHFLSSPNGAGQFQIVLDVNAMVAGDVLELRAYKMTIASGTQRQIWLHILYGAQTLYPVLISNWITNELTDTNAVRFSIKQTFGTGRSIPWDVIRETSQVDVVAWLGYAIGSTATNGLPDVNVKNINNVSTSSVTTINANQGTTQPVNFTGTAGSALVKSDAIDLAGQAITAAAGVTFPTSVASPTNITAGTLTTVTTATNLTTNNDKTGYALTAGEHTNVIDDVRAGLSAQRGTAQAGAASTITLAAGASASDSLYLLAPISIVSGTGAGQTRFISAYVGSTKVATVETAWVTNPDNTSVYEVLVTARNVASAGGGATAAQVWDYATASIVTAATIGKLLKDDIDATISSRTKPADTQARVTLVDTLTTYTGNTVQTGDVYARLGAPAGASTAVDIAAVKTDTAAVKVQTDKMTFTVANQIDANALKIGGTTQTGRDIGASVLLSTGTGTGQLDFTSGVVKANLAQILGTALTETAGQLTGGFKKFFNIATPAATMDHGILVDTVTTYTGNTLQTGDSFARIGAAGAGLTALGDTRIANLDAAVTTRLAPTTAGRTLDVATTGEAGLDFDNIKDATGAHTLTNITVPLVTTTTTATTATNVTTVNGLAAGVITAASIAANAITAAKVATDAIGAAQLATDAVTEIQTGLATPTNITAGTITTVTNLTNAPTAGDLTAAMKTSVENAAWNATLASHLTAGSTGAALNSAGSAGDPWGTALPGAYGAGSAGKIVGDNLNATVSSRLAPTTAGRTLDVATTGEAGLDFDNVKDATGAHTLTNIRIPNVTLTDTVTTLTGYTTPPTVAAIRTEMDTNSTKLANLDATVSSRMATFAYTTPPTVVDIRTEIDANSTKLDAAVSTRATPTNITAGTITTVTNLTNAPTSGDFTAAMKTSLNAATPSSTLSLAERNSLADVMWRRNATSIEASLDGESLSIRSPFGMMAKLTNKVAIVASTLTVYKADDTTALGTQTVGTSASADPIVSVDTV